MAVDPEVEPWLVYSSLSLCQLKGNGGFSCYCQQEATVWGQEEGNHLCLAVTCWWLGKNLVAGAQVVGK